jgi:hypothetical protein
MLLQPNPAGLELQPGSTVQQYCQVTRRSLRGQPLGLGLQDLGRPGAVWPVTSVSNTLTKFEL